MRYFCYVCIVLLFAYLALIFAFICLVLIFLLCSLYRFINVTHHRHGVGYFNHNDVPDAYRFFSPELLYTSGHKPEPERCLVWSLGVLLREMVLLRFPFDVSEVWQSWAKKPGINN